MEYLLQIPADRSVVGSGAGHDLGHVPHQRWLGHADTRMVHRHYGHLLSYDDDINAIGRPTKDV